MGNNISSQDNDFVVWLKEQWHKNGRRGKLLVILATLWLIFWISVLAGIGYEKGGWKGVVAVFTTIFAFLAVLTLAPVLYALLRKRAKSDPKLHWRISAGLLTIGVSLPLWLSYRGIINSDVGFCWLATGIILSCVWLRFKPMRSLDRVVAWVDRKFFGTTY